MWKCWQGWFRLEDFGTCPFMVRCGKGGFSTRSSWTADPSLRKRFLPSGSGHVRSFGSTAGRNFGSDCYLRSTFSPQFWLQLHDLLFCPVISEKQPSIFLQIEYWASLGWFCGYSNFYHSGCLFDKKRWKRPRQSLVIL